MGRRWRACGLAALVLGALVPVAQARADVLARAAVLANPCRASDWPMFGHDLDRSFSSPDTCITTLTAPTLRPKWFVNTSSPVTAQPAVADGVVYAGTFDGRFYALHAADGTLAWPAPFDATAYDKEHTDYGVIPDSAAVVTLGKDTANPRRVVVFAGGDTVFALDASTGGVLGHQCLDRVDVSCHGGAGFVTEAESSPAIVPRADGSALVLIGTDVNEHDPSGPAGLVALVLDRQGHLSPDWWFEPENGQTYDGLAPVQTLGHLSDHGCGDVWSSPAVDAKRTTVVFGTGNCNRPSEVASGATVPVESTFGLDLASGRLKWQAHPHLPGNGLDVDFGATPNWLGSNLVGEGGKDGVYYAYRLDGTPAWSVRTATGSDIGGMIGSTAVGRFSDGHDAVFAATAIPVSEADREGSVTNDLTHPNQAFGVHAIDAATHQVRWDAPVGPAYGAAVYAGGVVFVPDTFSDAVVALDADTGAVLRAQPVNVPPSSPVAISGDSVFVGAGTTETSPPLNQLASLGGIWAFTTTP